MNKLKNTETAGGYPLVMDDFRFMQNAFRDGFKGLLHAVSFIDFGLAGTSRHISFPDEPDLLIDASNSWTFPETYVFYNGEIFRIPETVLNSDSSGWSYVFSTAISDDPNGTKTLQDATVIETHEIREGALVRTQAALITDFIVLTGNASGYVFKESNQYRARLTNYLALQDLKDEETNILNLLQESTSGWVTITPTTTNVKTSTSIDGTNTTDAVSIGGGYIKYKKIGSLIHVDVNIEDVEVQNGGAGYIFSITIGKSILGVSSLTDFRAVSRMTSDQVFSLSGNGLIFASNNKIVFNMPRPFENGYARLNDGYELQPNPSMQVTALNYTASQPKWTIEGQFTMEIQ